MQDTGQDFEDDRFVFCRESEHVHGLQQGHEILVVVLALDFKRAPLRKVEGVKVDIDLQVSLIL